MRPAILVRFVVVLGIVVGLGITVAAAAEPTTLWNFLGIPQGMHKIRDAVSNPRGNHPGLERKPPMKAIADPANLEADNPAIKKAAEVKAQEDLAPQKIKAIKYLATVGCACYEGVDEALLAALGDCTEDVRLEAAVALCEASGNPCKICGSTCCNAEIMTKLQDMAEGRDANGCYKEPSAEVRAAARNALNACRRKLPVSEPTPVKPERKKETTPTPAPPETPASASAPWITPASMSEEIVPQAGDAGEAMAAEPTAYVYSCPPRQHRWCPPWRRRTMVPGEAYVVPEPGAKPEEMAPETPIEEPFAPPTEGLAGTFGAPTGPSPTGLNSIGDFFGGGAIVSGFGFNEVTLGTAGGDRLFKIVENESPLPQDRLFFNYNHFHNALRDALEQDRNLDRYTFGIEKTFLDGLTSVEFRVPFSSGYNSTQTDVFGAPLSATEFGNMALAVKGILLRRRCLTLTGGLGITFPTGEDFSVFGEGDSVNDPVELFRVENEAVHLRPFLAAFWQPNDRLYAQFFTQLDFDANGNSTFIANNPFRGIDDPSVQEQVFQDQTLLFMDVSLGYWLYRNECNRFLTGIIPVIELHYSTTVQDTDLVTNQSRTAVVTSEGSPSIDGVFSQRSANLRRDVLNVTGGCHFNIGRCSTLTVAAVAPLRRGEVFDGGDIIDTEALFDAEFLVQFNRRF